MHVVVIVAVIEAYYRISHGVWLPWPLAGGALLVGYFSLTPRTMRPIAGALLRLVHRIGHVNNFLVLSIIFFGILTPIGFLMRRLSREGIELKPRDGAGSYWRTRAGRGTDIDFTKMH